MPQDTTKEVGRCTFPHSNQMEVWQTIKMLILRIPAWILKSRQKFRGILEENSVNIKKHLLYRKLVQCQGKQICQNILTSLLKGFYCHGKEYSVEELLLLFFFFWSRMEKRFLSSRIDHFRVKRKPEITKVVSRVKCICIICP